MWEIKSEGYEPAEISRYGNLFLLGNGYLGVRGTVDEAGKEQFAAVNLAGVYDQSGEQWRETVNAPNGFFTVAALEDGRRLGLDVLPDEHTFSLDLKRAVLTRVSVFRTEAAAITVRSERFVHKKHANISAIKYAVSADRACRVTLRTGIDAAVWDINGPHFVRLETQINADCLSVTGTTNEGKTVKTEAVIRGVSDACTPVEQDGAAVREYAVTLTESKAFSFEKIISVTHDGSGEIYPLDRADYEKLLASHTAAWAELWDKSDVIVRGAPDDQLALRYSIYHLLCLAPHSERTSIAARGLSGQTYKGAVFWDTEVFMLPFFLNTDRATAKNLVMYRVHTLSGAREKAKEYGYRGAFYAWESQEDGRDACSEYNVTDAETGKPVRTYFRDKQIHISGDVVYGVMKYLERYRDDGILYQGAAAVVLECARFYLSYLVENTGKNRYDVDDVIGPDEYHERVNNNAFTNRMVLFTLRSAVEVLKTLAADDRAYHNKLIAELDFAAEAEALPRVMNRLFLKTPDASGVIEQFDGYFALEDTTPAVLKTRLKHPNEYWGGENGVAAGTQVIKQADVLTMLELFPDYDTGILRANWAYYESRTEHGSSLSACMYALGAIRAGQQDAAYPLFHKTATIDMTGESKQWAGGIYIGGTHPAANGGAYLTAVYGFGGLCVKDGKVAACPALPAHWQGMVYKIDTYAGTYQVTIEGEKVEIKKER